MIFSTLIFSTGSTTLDTIKLKKIFQNDVDIHMQALKSLGFHQSSHCNAL